MVSIDVSAREGRLTCHDTSRGWCAPVRVVQNKCPQKGAQIYDLRRPGGKYVLYVPIIPLVE